MRVITIAHKSLPKVGDKVLYGYTNGLGNVASITINNKQAAREFINTFFHEVAHAFMHFYGKNISDKEEERLCRLVGDVVEPCFGRIHVYTNRTITKKPKRIKKSH